MGGIRGFSLAMNNLLQCNKMLSYEKKYSLQLFFLKILYKKPSLIF